MALSVIVIPGDGVTTQFNIPFSLGYIKESDISARVGSEVDGAGNPVYRALTFLSPENVDVAGPPAKVGENIVFTRTVDQEQLLVDFEDGDVINEVNMNTAQRQAIMLVHQVLDGRFAQFQTSIDLGGFRITGVGEPVDPQDAATKNYIDARISTGQASAAAAAASAAAALASQQAASASAAAASGAVTASLNSATVSTNARDAALSYRNAADGFRGQAATSASQAAASNASAGTSASNASSSASAAATSASQAQGFRNQSETLRDQSASSASAAATSATNAASAHTYAYRWAQQVENTQVNDGVRTGYSSFHWAAKAAASAAAAQKSAEDAALFDPSSYYTRDESDDKYLTLTSAQADFYTKTEVGTLVGGRVAKSGDTMTGDLAIAKSYPSTRFLYPGVRDWTIQVREDGGIHFWDNSGDSRRFSIGYDGAVWTAQFGDLNTRIEARAAAHADARAWAVANDRVANLHTRWVARGEADMNYNVWREAPAGSAVTGFYVESNNFMKHFCYRYFQLFDPVRGWITAHNA